ncbi:MAG: hypothetical protein GY754_46650 [bacterium]|nr:hypothetical protein [bacterium]
MKRFLFIGVLVFVFFTGCEGEGFNSSDPNTEFAELKAEVAELKRILEGVDRLNDPNTNQPTIRFSGVNVQIVSGSGSTGGDINGLGNLIVGYNEERSSGSEKPGSHNIIVGPEHNYTSFGGFVVGYHNTISDRFASVSGGNRNTASGQRSSVSGGNENTARGDFSSVSGGHGNTVSGLYSSVTGGQNRNNTADYNPN